MRMSTRSEKEKQKTLQEKYQAILSNLLKDDDNKYCVDCDAKGPRWASWNLGVFLCIRCAGIHRNLGVHISKVKSVNLDTWTPEQISMMMEIGNSRARAAYEANLPDGYRRPQTDSALESFIRAKYEQKKYIAKEWVPPKPTVPKDLLDDDNDKKKIKPKGAQLTMTGTSSETQGAVATTSKPSPKPVQISQVQTPQQPAMSLASKQSTNTVDLIGLVPYLPSLGNSLEAVTPVKTNTSNSLLEDFMGVPQSSSQLTSQPINNLVSNGSLETSLFGETNDNNTKVSTKDSIMALYGGQPTQQQFGVPGQYYGFLGGMYMPQQVQPAGSLYGMTPQQQMLMQQGLYGNQMGMMGMPPASMTMGSMGMQPQSGMSPPQRMAGVHPMYSQQAPMQQMQYQQMQQQMTNMNLGQPQMGWGGPSSSGHTLSTNLWQ